jgi:hypothetical protein
MPELVKGAGFSRAPDKRDLPMDEVFSLSKSAEAALMEATKNGIANPQGVAKSFNPLFMPQLSNFMAAGGVGNGAAIQELLEIVGAELGKNITLTSPLSTGLVPFDLAAPSRLIYPVYSPLRNRIPRVPGRGTSHRAKILTAISGSQTGQAILDVAIPELVSSGGSLNNWPLNLPPAGAQTAVDWNIPYKFFGVSESASFLAQFAGAGFEDAYALANFVLMQEALQNEEYQMLEATGTAVTAPTISLSLRTPGSNETAISGLTTNLYVRVTATNFFGETTATMAHNAPSSQVCDVTITPARGASQYKVYVGTGTADPGASGCYYIGTVGGSKFTVQGAIPTTGTTPPTADTGTSSSYRYEGLLSILDGHAVTDASVYPSGFDAGYIGNVGTTLVSSVVDTALKQLWDLSSNSFRANPAELLGEGSDIVNLSQDIKTNTSLNYRIMIDMDQVAGMRGGAAISEYVNPVTRSSVAITVHPWLRQGVSYLLSYTLPQPFSNVSNVFENVMVQDLVGIQWPVIDASYRSSAFWYGTFSCYAPQYCAVLKGIQQSSSTPWT